MSVQRRGLAVLVAFLLLLPEPPRAAEPDDELEREFGFLEAEEIEKIPVAVATRGEKVPFGMAPAVVDVVTEDEIRASGARTLAELLSQRVGIDVSSDRVVPRGLNTTPSVGTPLFNNRSLLLIDGRPSNGVFFGEFLAGRELPLEHIARVEIIRGPGSALYGTNAMAGVINVVTKDAADVPPVGVIGELGTQSTRRGDLYGGGGRPQANGNFFLRYYGTGGADEPNRHDNQREFFGFARSALGPLRLEGEALQFREEVAGTGSDRIDRERYSIGAHLAHDLAERFQVDGRVYANVYQTRLLVTASNPDRSTYDERRIGEELSLRYRAFDWLSVTFGGEARQESGEVGPLRCIRRAGENVEASPRGCDLGRDVLAGFLEDQIELLPSLALTTGFRYDRVSDVDASRLSPRANLVWRAAPATALKVGYGEAFRAPSFFELQGAQRFGAEQLVVGNPDLDPEVVRTVDGELSHRFSRALNLRLSAFYTRGKDLIVQERSDEFPILDPLPFPVAVPPIIGDLLGLLPDDALPPGLRRSRFRFVNAARVDARGLEAAIGGAVAIPIGELAYGLNYTLQDTRNRRLGDSDLPLAPPHKMNLLLDYRPIRDLSIFWHTRWEDRQFADGRERESIANHFDHDLYFIYQLTRSFQGGLGVYNVSDSDARDAADMVREPVTVLASLRWEWSPGPSLPAAPAELVEPPELGEARAAVERARAAGGNRAAPADLREAEQHLAEANALQGRRATRDTIVEEARRASEAADRARKLAEAMPLPPSAAAETPAAEPEATATVMARQAILPVRPSRAEPALPSAFATPPAMRTRARAVPTGGIDETPIPGATRTPAATGLVRSPTPRPTTTATRSPSPTATPTATETPNLAARRVLLLQSDGRVETYAATARALMRSVPGTVELQDLAGDAERGAQTVREAAGRADLVVAVGALAATTARREAADRPVLFCAVLNPRRHDLASRSAGGVSFEVSAERQLQELRRALPNVTRVGVLYDPQKSAAFLDEANHAASRFGLRIVPAVVRDPRDVGFVLRSLRKDIDVLLLVPDSTVLTRESFEVIRTVAAETRTPLIAFSEAFARQGALLAFQPKAESVGEQCARLAERILRGDLHLSDVGVRAPEEVRVVVNRRVEDILGVPISRSVRPDVEVR
ncbi:MAG: hypothetical protein QOD06_3349 [Candidatus Binatota bacterium]|nr:hypothetical protein [Candidatus Binatota bacterium]